MAKVRTKVKQSCRPGGFQTSVQCIFMLFSKYISSGFQNIFSYYFKNIFLFKEFLPSCWGLSMIMTEETDIAAEMKETKHKTQNTMVAKNKQEFTADNLPPFMQMKNCGKLIKFRGNQAICGPSMRA